MRTEFIMAVGIYTQQQEALVSLFVKTNRKEKRVVVFSVHDDEERCVCVCFRVPGKHQPSWTW